ncbi:hypothetical protein SPRG_04601 [Saprolegnia parasitica CBS 223.65]|uniref:Uncharacterized protein n=1 Tax=Saprolegnia parasitica (strain CBS 223.65) TaxID=695850 RepID=A0A067CJ22_SAPPC|nr:hypothetical protein SPRG_04601 [Saprolegnia parasitica CBS 223.65]KDO30699.1 hypothetical protein SPRG_04601 [Saprolegnia parasitica CBS 223.65]|eukprot:XP_012198403.1 hypothetical protein SPRG_04601 [Saprolegnia parasitica CBS 223.65]
MSLSSGSAALNDTPIVAPVSDNVVVYSLVISANLVLVLLVFGMIYMRRAANKPLERPMAPTDPNDDDDRSSIGDGMSSVVLLEVLTPCDHIVTSAYSSVEPPVSIHMTKLSMLSEGRETNVDQLSTYGGGDDEDDADVIVLSRDGIPSKVLSRWSAFHYRPGDAAAEDEANRHCNGRTTYPNPWTTSWSVPPLMEPKPYAHAQQPTTTMRGEHEMIRLSAQSSWSQWHSGCSYGQESELSIGLSEDDDGSASSLNDDRISFDSAALEMHLASAA